YITATGPAANRGGAALRPTSGLAVLELYSVTALSNGTWNQKLAPCPGALTSPITPPIRSTRLLEIASPNPVPPYLRVIEPAPWVNGENRRDCTSCGIPAPSSLTSNRSVAPPASSEAFEKLTVIRPASENLTAFPIKLTRTWRTRA